MQLSIIIPAYNEEANLKPLLESIIMLRKNHNLDCEIVIVNDNSRDSTGDIARNFSKNYSDILVIHRDKGNNGMGAALKQGTAKAGGDIIIWVMADQSDELGKIPDIAEKIQEDGYDLVFCSRYMKQGSRGDLSIFKAFLSSRFTVLARFIFGLRVHDITNAFRGFKKEVFNKINLKADDFSISPEFAIKAHLLGFKLGEIPAAYKDRKLGKSKFNILRMVCIYLKVLLSISLNLREFKRRLE